MVRFPSRANFSASQVEIRLQVPTAWMRALLQSVSVTKCVEMKEHTTLTTATIVDEVAMPGQMVHIVENRGGLGPAASVTTCVEINCQFYSAN